jgi:transcriptional regulator GlxA family with amidase domain
MDRRNILRLIASISAVLPGISRSAEPVAGKRNGDSVAEMSVDALPHVSGQKISVAFVLSRGAELVDFAGPWGVFEYVFPPDERAPFQLFTVADSTAPLAVSGGMTIVPDHSFTTAPQPKVIVVPAMEPDVSESLLHWIRMASKKSDLTMSVCNGAFVLAKAGLLSGKEATCHHGAYALFQADFPDIKVKRGARFVDAGSVATAGGLTSGIDLALHVVARYFGRPVAEQTALSLEYQGLGWKDPDSNVAFAKKPVSTDAHPVCPVCEMEVEKNAALREVYNGKTYYFCSEQDKHRFDQTPERFE